MKIMTEQDFKNFQPRTHHRGYEFEALARLKSVVFDVAFYDHKNKDSHGLPQYIGMHEVVVPVQESVLFWDADGTKRLKAVIWDDGTRSFANAWDTGWNEKRQTHDPHSIEVGSGTRVLTVTKVPEKQGGFK